MQGAEVEQRPLAVFVPSSLYSLYCREGVFSETQGFEGMKRGPGPSAIPSSLLLLRDAHTGTFSTSSRK